MDDVVGAWLDREAARDTLAANTARLAVVTAAVRTTGHGLLRVPDPVVFGFAFTAPPRVATGVDLDGVGLEDADGTVLELPAVSAGVSQWLTDGRGLVRGAALFVHVGVDDSGIGAELAGRGIGHHFVFTGLALTASPGVDVR